MKIQLQISIALTMQYMRKIRIQDLMLLTQAQGCGSATWILNNPREWFPLGRLDNGQVQGWTESKYWLLLQAWPCIWIESARDNDNPTTGHHKLCHPAIPVGWTWSKLGKHGKHQLDDLEHSIYDSKHSSYDSMRTLSDLWMPLRPWYVSQIVSKACREQHSQIPE